VICLLLQNVGIISEPRSGSSTLHTSQIIFPSQEGQYTNYKQSSILNVYNLSAEYAHRYWLIEERSPLPIVFDISRTPNITEKMDFSNIAISPAPFNPQAFLVAVRTSKSEGKRWGTVCNIGLVDANLLASLIGEQSQVEVQYPTIPAAIMDDGYTSIKNHSKSQNEELPTARGKYHQLLEKVSATHELYGSYADTKVWLRPLCSIPDLHIRDVRLFFRKGVKSTAENSAEICIVSQISGQKVPIGMYIGCFDSDGLEYSKNEEDAPRLDSAAKVTQAACPTIDSLFRIPKGFDHRNLVPLVEGNGMHWQDSEDGDGSLTWMMDTMGGKKYGPLIYPLLIPHNSTASIEAGVSSNAYYELKDCDYLSEWRGNSPVVRFTDHLWATVVHQYKKTREVMPLNKIGRTYKNKLVIFEADFPGMLPSRCMRTGPDAASRDVLQRQPDLDFEWPFAFVLGIVHMGKVATFIEGEQHRFLLSAGLDDFQPSATSIDVFIPHAVVRKRTFL
jgi:hypothetical protein